MASLWNSTPLLRSVSDIIISLKNSPKSDANFKQAELEFLAKEQHARSNRDVLEEKCTSLTLQVLHLEGENRRLTRECEVLSDSVEVMKQREDQSDEMYQRAKDNIEFLERKNDELCCELERVQSYLMERVRMLEDDIEGLMRVLGENNGKECEYEEIIHCLKRFVSEKDEEIILLGRKVEVLEGKLKSWKEMWKEMENAIETIQKKSGDQCVVLGRICEGYRSDEDFFEECLGDDDEIERRIEEVKKKVECMKKEKEEVMKNKEGGEKEMWEIMENEGIWIIDKRKYDEIVSEAVAKSKSGSPSHLVKT